MKVNTNYLFSHDLGSKCPEPSQQITVDTRSSLIWGPQFLTNQNNYFHLVLFEPSSVWLEEIKCIFHIVCFQSFL